MVGGFEGGRVIGVVKLLTGVIRSIRKCEGIRGERNELVGEGGGGREGVGVGTG